MTGSLIEYLIYCSIISILVVGLMHYSVVVHQRVSVQHYSLQNLLQAGTVQSMLTRDIWQAPVQNQHWYAPREGEVIWRDEDEDIGWYVQGTDLYRIVGEYDAQRHRWTASRKGLVSKDVKNFKVMRGPVRTCCMVRIGNCKELVWEVAPRSLGAHG